MNISMDKYKTSELGQALKKVYRGEISVEESVGLAEKEIKEIFSHVDDDDGTGFYGDAVGKCPLCGKDVVRGTYSYDCTAPKDKCGFRINLRILGATVSLKNARKLLSEGKTEKIEFMSSSGKKFTSELYIAEDKKIKFKF